jgi:hypothetical protein
MPGESKKTSHLSKLAWILIALGFLSAAAFVIWINRQSYRP